MTESAWSSTTALLLVIHTLHTFWH